MKFLEELGKGDSPQVPQVKMEVKMEGDLAMTPSLGGAHSVRAATM